MTVASRFQGAFFPVCARKANDQALGQSRAILLSRFAVPLHSEENLFRYGGPLVSGRRTRSLKKWSRGRFHSSCQAKIVPGWPTGSNPLFIRHAARRRTKAKIGRAHV